MKKKLPSSFLIQQIKDKIRLEQDDVCPLCETSFSIMEPNNICLDHDHETGLVRGVLCRNCNSMEGKISNCIRRARRALSSAKWFYNLVRYWTITHASNPAREQIMHPTHKTKDQKRELRNARARRKRKKDRDS